MSTPNFEDDSKSAAPQDLKAISDAATKMDNLATKIKTAKDSLKELEGQYSAIETVDLPDLMDAAGMSEFSLSDGTKIKIMPIIKAALPTLLNINKQRDEDKQEEMRTRFEDGIKYLTDAGSGAIIKDEVVIDVGKGGGNIAGDIIAQVSETYGLDADHNKSVNAQTLSAWVREKLAAGEDVPFDTFAVYTGRKAKITKAR